MYSIVCIDDTAEMLSSAKKTIARDSIRAVCYRKQL